MIGKAINRILCTGVDIDSNYNLYEFSDAISISFDELREYIVIGADFDETHFGGDFNRLKLSSASKPAYIPTTEEGYIEGKNVCLMVKPDFRITKIEIHGFSGKDESDNLKLEPFWQIEKNNPSVSITEYIESEHVLIFHAKDGRQMLIYPDGILPWMRVSFDNAVINDLIPIKNSDGVILTKLKKVIS